MPKLIALVLLLLYTQGVYAQCHKLYKHEPKNGLSHWSDPVEYDSLWDATVVETINSATKEIFIKNWYAHVHGLKQTHSFIDSTGRMMRSEAYMFDKKGCLVQSTVNRETFYAIYGNTPCDFTIIDSSGDSTSYNSDIDYGSSVTEFYSGKNTSDAQYGRFIILNIQGPSCEEYKKKKIRAGPELLERQKEKDGKR
jgi:hypothetical protein